MTNCETITRILWIVGPGCDSDDPIILDDDVTKHDDPIILDDTLTQSDVDEDVVLVGMELKIPLPEVANSPGIDAVTEVEEPRCEPEKVHKSLNHHKVHHTHQHHNHRHHHHHHHRRHSTVEEVKSKKHTLPHRRHSSKDYHHHARHSNHQHHPRHGSHSVDKCTKNDLHHQEHRHELHESLKRKRQIGSIDSSSEAESEPKRRNTTTRRTSDGSSVGTGSMASSELHISDRSWMDGVRCTANKEDCLAFREGLDSDSFTQVLSQCGLRPTRRITNELSSFLMPPKHNKLEVWQENSGIFDPELSDSEQVDCDDDNSSDDYYLPDLDNDFQIKVRADLPLEDSISLITPNRPNLMPKVLIPKLTLNSAQTILERNQLRLNPIASALLDECSSVTTPFCNPPSAQRTVDIHYKPVEDHEETLDSNEDSSNGNRTIVDSVLADPIVVHTPENKFPYLNRNKISGAFGKQLKLRLPDTSKTLKCDSRPVQQCMNIAAPPNKKRHFLDILSHISSSSSVVSDDCVSNLELEEVLPDLDDDEISSVHSSSPRIVHHHPVNVATVFRENVNVRTVRKRDPQFHVQCLRVPPIYPGGDSVCKPDENDNLNTYFVRQISQAQVNLIESLAEDGNTYDTMAVNFIEKFTNANTEPTVELMSYLFHCLCQSKGCTQSYALYNLLQRINHLHPPNHGVCFTWDNVTTVVQDLGLLLGVHTASPFVFMNNGRILQYMVCSIEDDLTHRVVTCKRNVIRSSAFQWLSADIHFPHVQEVISWVAIAVNCREYRDAVEEFFPLHLPPALFLNSPSTQIFHTPQKHRSPLVSPSSTSSPKSVPDHFAQENIRYSPKILPLVQRLLNLSLAVSMHPNECARKIATSLSHEYTHMPNLCHRRLLISSTVSPLLRMKLAQMILEDYCNQGIGCSHMAANLEDLVLTYFSYEPPVNTTFTPPQTPSDVGDGDEDPSSGQIRFTRESVEELVLLLFTVLDSYLAVTREKLLLPLHQRMLSYTSCLNSPQKHNSSSWLSNIDRHTLANLDVHISTLENNLLSLTSELTPRTKSYLSLMSSLPDILTASDTVISE